MTPEEVKYYFGDWSEVAERAEKEEELIKYLKARHGALWRRYYEKRKIIIDWDD